MSGFFVEKAGEVGEILQVSGEDFHHIKNVIRKRPGDELILSDGKGFVYKTVIKRIYKDCLEAEIEEKSLSDTEPPIKVTLYQGIPKGEKFELIIQKCTEIGIWRIVPVHMKRCVSKVNEDAVEKKVVRWNKIAMEAAKQSNRSFIPKVDKPLSFHDAIDEAKKMDFILLPYEKEYGVKLKSILKRSIGQDGNSSVQIAMFVGTEGGFEESEIEEAIEAGALTVSLGPRILRTETAGFSLLSILMYEFGDMG